MSSDETWSTAEAGAVQGQEQEKAPYVHDDASPVLVGGGGPTEAGWHSAEAGIWCQKEAQLKYIRRIRTPELSTPDHFIVGRMLHAGRAEWFSRRFATGAADVQAVLDAALADAAKDKQPVTEGAKTAAFKYLREYIDFWGVRPNPRPVAAEYLVGPAPLQLGDQFPLWRTARLDDVGYYQEAPNAALCIGECKTTSGSISSCISQYTLHGQPLLQYVLWRNSEQGQAKYGPVAGVVLDIVKKGYGKERSQFARHFIEIPEHAIKWYVQNMRRYLREFSALDWNTDAERNIHACTRIVGKERSACPYRDLCLRGKAAASNYVFEDSSRVDRWIPSGEQVAAPWD